MDLNEENLDSMGISRAEYEGMEYMSHWLILIPIVFLLLGVFMGGFIRCVEKWIRARELRELKKKEYVRKDGTLDRIQYLRDLYRIIQNYLGELKNDDPIQLLLKRMEKMENKEEENIRFKKLEEMVYNFFNDLRFSDDTKMENKILEISSEKSNKENGSDTEESEPDLKTLMAEE